MDAGDEMARLAIRIYTERNEACHAEIGNPNIARYLQPLVTQASALGARMGGSDPKREPPYALLVHFDRYDGPAYQDVDGHKIVPVFRSKREFAWGNISCTRTQFPITVAYAMTVHKSQGITVSQGVLNISSCDFSPGLTYVAVSYGDNAET